MSKVPNAKLLRWADLIDESEMQAYAKAGFGEKLELEQDQHF